MERCRCGNFIAKLLTIIDSNEVLNSPEVSGTMKAKANRERIDLYSKNHTVAILNIQGTDSYQIYFLKKNMHIKDIEDDLLKFGAVLNHDSKLILKNYIEMMSDEGRKRDR
ncbi:DUF749 domain-containing protein [Methanococcus voltae]|uniref:Uncharacterized protein n=1 Tax=Methanococcus voltae (strain ATCC BAA-1334 / A3) TaxID=456320 RepID=D7DUI5_METV3|nr:DUF749 domain-containing protein [Methanococcus voltae]MCS3900595.1 hypothetical protein [Methanococcus voltae]